MASVEGARRVAFVTSSALPDGSPDDRLTFGELRRHGFEPVPAVWDDAALDWGAFDLAIVRSTWDYHRRREAFLDWVGRAARSTTVLNPPELLRWNSHKAYLLELARAGHAVVPTELLPRGAAVSLEELLERRGWREAVVKPAVSASSEGLFRVAGPPTDPDRARFKALLDAGEVLVQPFLSGAPERGERSVIYFNGRFSHAAEYPYLLGDGIRSERIARRRAPGPEELERCARILGELPVVPLYARLDFIPDADGRWWLGELELVEPELLFRCDPGAAARFAPALAEGAPDSRRRGPG